MALNDCDAAVGFDATKLDLLPAELCNNRGRCLMSLAIVNLYIVYECNQKILNNVSDLSWEISSKIHIFSLYKKKEENT